MSRTFKDRPLEVREHDVTEDRKPYHNHFNLGREVYGSRPLKDENGHPVFKTVTREIYTRDAATSQILYVEREVQVRAYEKYLVGVISNTCTLNEEINSNYSKTERWALFPCRYYLTYGYIRTRPRRKDKVLYHGAARAGERNALSQLTKRVNANYEVLDDFEEDVLYARRRLHKGWWD